MSEEVEDGPFINRPFHSSANRLEKPIELPAASPESADVADRTHRDFDQAIGIDEGLCRLLGLDDAIQQFVSRLHVRFRRGVGRILAADPREALIEKHFADFGLILEAVRKAARSSKTGGIDADASLQRGAR